MNIQDFLNQHTVSGTQKSVAISERFVDEGGMPLLFTIKPMEASFYEEARRKAQYVDKSGKTQMDSKVFMTQVVIENTIVPNFKEARSIESLGLISPEQYLNHVLLSGEMFRLAKEIFVLSGFDHSMNDLIATAKN